MRQIGPNYEGLVEKYNKMVALGETTETQPGDLKWIPYGSRYQAYYQERLKAQYEAHTSDF